MFVACGSNETLCSATYSDIRISKNIIYIIVVLSGLIPTRQGNYLML